jgi:hypothetical protein
MKQLTSNRIQITAGIVAVLLILLPILAAVAAPPKRAARREAETAVVEGTNATALCQRINALESLFEMKATREQMQALEKLSAETAPSPQKPEPRQIEPRLRRTMQELHDALVAAKDEDRIESLQDKYDDMVEAQKIDFGDDVEITKAASEKAPAFVRTLTVSQIASLISANDADVRDPKTVLTEALAEGRSQKDDEWKETRDSAADEAATLIAGLAGSTAKSEKLKQWLDEAHKLSEAEYKSQFTEPADAAAKVTGELSWPQVLQNWVEFYMADLLSNPELHNAIEERLQ